MGLTRSVRLLKIPVFKKKDSRFKTRRQLIFMFGWSGWLILSAARGHSDGLLVPVVKPHLDV
jgi:hypothetical protein